MAEIVNSGMETGDRSQTSMIENYIGRPKDKVG